MGPFVILEYCWSDAEELGHLSIGKAYAHLPTPNLRVVPLGVVAHWCRFARVRLDPTV